MLTYVWKQRRIGLLCNAMKNHALQERRTARAVPLSPPWQVRSATWQLSISMINAVVPGLPVTKLQSMLLPCFKVKWVSRTTHVHQNARFAFTCLSNLVGLLMYDLNYLKTCLIPFPAALEVNNIPGDTLCCWYLSIAIQMNPAIKMIIFAFDSHRAQRESDANCFKKYSSRSE